MSEKNAFAILGSPHADGMTAAMLGSAIWKVGQMGHTVAKIGRCLK